MKLYFKPMPWLTVFGALGLLLLLKLGFWQKDRLAWKTDLLARVEAAAQAPAFTSLAQVTAALQSGDPVDYRRYAFDIEAIKNAPAYHVYDPAQTSIGWRVFSVYENSGVNLYLADMQRFDDAAKKAKTAFTSPQHPASSGYVRLSPKPARGLGKWIKSKPSPASNRWFAFNQDGLWESSGINMDIWLDEHSEGIKQDLPVSRPDIRNNHRDYMWTWFSLAGLLIIFYGLIHYRAKRLSWGKQAGI